MAPLAMFCRTCGYDLRGQFTGEELRCPECGGAFDPAVRKTFRRRAQAPLWRRRLFRLLIVMAPIAILATALWGWLYLEWSQEQKCFAALKISSFHRTELGGAKLHARLGSMGWITERISGVHLGPWINDSDLPKLRQLKHLDFLNLSESKITDTGLVYVKEHEQLTTLWIDNTDVTDAGLKHLSGLTKLTNLWINGTKVSDLRHLSRLRDLKYLLMNDTPVNDAGLVPVRNFKHLRRLFLNNTKIEDDSLHVIKELTSLDILRLRNTKITDKGLAELKQLKKLTSLDIRGTAVTEAGVKKLQAELPRLKIEWP
jgi:hypothetical protein